MLFWLFLGLTLGFYNKDLLELNKQRWKKKLWNTPLKDHPYARHTPPDHRSKYFKNKKLADECYQDWPDCIPCYEWHEEDGYLIGLSNNIPPWYVPPYCPYGIGEGYCQSPTVGNSTDCAPFRGITCPCDPNDNSHAQINCPKNTPASGDIVVPDRHEWAFPLNPDPTNSTKPWHMYDNVALTGDHYQVIGSHLLGLEIKGPAEANGFNVDLSLIPFVCGGHFTPPVRHGPVYHFHKLAECTNTSIPGHHGAHFGYANDGFKMYGVGDYHGTSVVDECNGHFGYVDDKGTIEYHYHAQAVYNMPGEHHKPYYLGCQGPSKGRCNETLNPDYDDGANWCGQGCGHEICVQPGTDRNALREYLGRFGNPNWLDQFDVNPF